MRLTVGMRIMAIGALWLALGPCATVPAEEPHLDPAAEGEGVPLDTEAQEDRQEELELEAEKSSRLGLPGVLNGFVWDTLESTLELRVGAQFLFDHASVQHDDDLETVFGSDTSDSEVRNAVINFRGSFIRDVDFHFELEIVSGDVELGTNYLERRDIPYLGTLRVGQFVEPFSLERVTSLRHQTFMERSLASAFAPGKNPGVMATNTHLENRLMWAAGVFVPVGSQESVIDSDGNGIEVTTRVTGLPILRDEGRQLLHVGGSYSHGRRSANVTMRPRPESFLAPRYLDTGELGVGSFNLFAAEVAWVNDQFSLQGEYAVAHAGDVENISDGRTGRATMHGGYVQANYFLTGEHRIYNYEKGAFGQVYPNRNFGLRQSRRGPGAWEIAARLSRIDLDDGPVSGGIQTNLSLGLNWYLNPSIRTSLNFIHANVNTADVEGEANIIQLRFQLDFSPKGIGEFRPAHVINNLRSSGSK